MAEKKTKVRKAEEAAKSGKASGFKKKLASPIVTVVLFAAAAVMLLTSTIGGTRAALNYYSEDYIAYVAMDHIGVTLLEKYNPEKEAKVISSRYYIRDSDEQYKLITEPMNEKGESVPGKLLSDMLGADEKLQLGKEYFEELSVYNSGGIDEYVRVTIYKYWLDPQSTDGQYKKQDMDPDLIHLNLVHPEVWLKDTEASRNENGAYKERTVLYYKNILEKGRETEPFCDSIMIDREIANKVREEVTKNGDYTTIKTIYAYDGVEFVLEVEVDAVQDHNAEDAILSAWGRRVKIENDSLVGSNGILGSPAQGE